jgi:hypothetical protein
MKPGPKPKDRSGSKRGTIVCITCKKSWPLSEYYKDKNRPNGLYPECKTCVLAKRKSTYNANPSKYRAASARHNEGLRRDAFNAYGGACACCKEQHSEFLTLDHVHNNGKQHRIEVGGTKGVYQWAKKQGYPQDGSLRILCYNCHMSRSFLGYCPHETKPASP